MSSRVRALALALCFPAIAMGVVPAASADEDVVVFSDDFESGAPGWQTGGLWHLSTVTGSTSMWYGDESTGTYNTGDANLGTAITPDVDLTGFAGQTVFLTYHEKVGRGATCGLDRTVLEISVDHGPFQALDDPCLPDGTERDVVFDVSTFTGHVVNVAFAFDTGDATDNGHFGWSVDNVRIASQAYPDVAWLASRAPTNADGSVELFASVGNLGTVDAPNTVVHYLILGDDGFSLEGDLVVSLPAQSSQELDLGAFPLPTQRYSLDVVVDASNQFPEANEANNEGLHDFMPGAPDYAGSAYGYRVGAQSFVRVDVRNFAGETDAVSTARFVLTDANGAALADETYDVQPLGLYAADERDFGPYDLPQGSYGIRVVADETDVIPETEEANNVFDGRYDAPADAPDLQVYESHPLNVATGNSLHVDVTAANQGIEDAFGVEVRVDVMQGDVVVDTAQAALGDVCANGCATSTSFDFAEPDGDYVLVATVDPADVVAEGDEANNQAVGSFHVGPGTADLVVASFTHTPDPASESDDVTLLIEVANQGSTFADASNLGLFVRWEDGSLEQFDTLGVPPLDAGGSIVLSYAVGQVPTGTYELHAVADHDDHVLEADESNNDAAHVLVVGGGGSPMPDLVASAFVPAAVEGQQVQLEARVFNEGTVAAGPFQVTALLDGEALGTFGYDGLESDTLVAQPFPWTATPGTHELTVIVDADNQVGESNEANNVATYSFVVQPPFVPKPADLSVTILGIDKSPVRTDLGAFGPNPLGRRTVEVAACNVGDEPLQGGSLDVHVEALAPKSLALTRAPIATFDVPALPGGACKTFFAKWDPAGSFGDVEVVAEGHSPDEVEGDPSNDADQVEDFVLLGGFGGITLL